MSDLNIYDKLNPLSRENGRINEPDKFQQRGKK
jgi:hypothetical protein